MSSVTLLARLALLRLRRTAAAVVQVKAFELSDFSKNSFQPFFLNAKIPVTLD